MSFKNYFITYLLFTELRYVRTCFCAFFFKACSCKEESFKESQFVKRLREDKRVASLSPKHCYHVLLISSVGNTSTRGRERSFVSLEGDVTSFRIAGRL